jgi:nucleotide-binding universal stress UspA family protein
VYRKILVPLDGSKFSECVLSHVKEVVSSGNVAEVVLLFVVEPISSAPLDVAGDWMEEATKRAMEFGKNYLKRISEAFGKSAIGVTLEVLKGPAAETILNYAQKNGVDLMIISTHGRSGITRWVFGSVADKVIHQSSIPVLIVSPPECRTTF